MFLNSLGVMSDCVVVACNEKLNTLSFLCTARSLWYESATSYLSFAFLPGRSEMC